MSFLGQKKQTTIPLDPDTWCKGGNNRASQRVHSPWHSSVLGISAAFKANSLDAYNVASDEAKRCPISISIKRLDVNTAECVRATSGRCRRGDAMECSETPDDRGTLPNLV
jgi:hypothetical protein